MGSYGILRVCVFTLPNAALQFQLLMAIIGIVSMVYGAFACLAQTDLKKMVAYSSISHMGLVMLGIATLSTLGITAAILMMFAHGLISAVLFMVAGMFQHKAGTREIPKLGGLALKLPMLSAIMMIGFLASVGLPGMVGFISEFSVFSATYQYLYLWVIIPMATIALTAAYYLWAMQRTIFGPLTDNRHASSPRCVWFELIPCAVLILLIALYGLWPNLIIGYITPSIPHIYPGVI